MLLNAWFRRILFIRYHLCLTFKYSPKFATVPLITTSCIDSKRMENLNAMYIRKVFFIASVRLLSYSLHFLSAVCVCRRYSDTVLNFELSPNDMVACPYGFRSFTRPITSQRASLSNKILMLIYQCVFSDHPHQYFRISDYILFTAERQIIQFLRKNNSPSVLFCIIALSDMQ